jgi:hypothetical protein
MSATAVSDVLNAKVSDDAKPDLLAERERMTFDFWDPSAFTDSAEGRQFGHAVINCRRAGEVARQHV